MRRPVTAALLSVFLLSACGTGLEAHTYQQRRTRDATSTQVGAILIRNLAVLPAVEGQSLDEGGQAVVTGTFVNTGSEDDQLTDAFSDVAGQIALQSADGTLPVPAGRTSPSSWGLVLDDLKTALQPGRYISVTLEFEKAGRTTVQVPVQTGDNGLGDREPEQDPYGEE